MTAEFIFQGSSLHNLREQLLGYSPKEAGAVLLGNSGNTPTTLLIDKIVTLPESAFREQSDYRLVIDPTFLAKLVKQGRTNNQSIVLVHTHPFTSHPNFSLVDDRGEEEMMPALFSRIPSRPHGSLVLGTEGYSARLYLTPQNLTPVEKIRQIGRQVAISLAREETALGTDIAFDRNVRSLGQIGQDTLRRIHVGIIGLGGTGSLVAQQLAHLGVGTITLLDDDKIEITNINRVVGASRSDVGRPKVSVAADMISHITSGRTESRAVAGSLLIESHGKAVFDCDFLFGCTDTHGSRALLNQIAYQYLIPTIDMGVRIDAQKGLITTMSGRIQMLAPGLACLQCQNLLDPEQVRRDLLSENERRADPYIVGEAEPQPSVISLNSTVSSLAVTMFLSSVTGFPVKSRRANYLIGDGTVRGVSTQPLPGCIVCSSEKGALAKGSSWPLFWRQE